MKIYLSPLAEYKLSRLLDYLEKEWGASAKESFIGKLTQRFEQISSHPKSFLLTDEFQSVHWCVVVSQCTVYFQIVENEIEIITITDNRQDPLKTKKEIQKRFK